MTIETPLAVLLSILFLIPGFIWQKSMQVFSPYAPTSKPELMDCLMLSCLNYLIGLPFIYLLLLFNPKDLDLAKLDQIVIHPLYLAFWLCIVFVLPVIAGVLSAKVASKPRLKYWLRKLGIAILHPAPTAWDYAFAREETYWARVELDDGSLLEGMFDSNSLASGKSEKRDIFLASLFEWNSELKQYEPVERNAGAWVGADRVRKITFFRTVLTPDGQTIPAGQPVLEVETPDRRAMIDTEESE